MFTGIIKTIGEVDRMAGKGGDVQITVRAPGLDWSAYAVGESIAINGVCLTAVALSSDGFRADVSQETLDVTALAGLKSGSRVNIEPALSVSERLGGHLVSGHVDGVARVKSRHVDARSIRLDIEVPEDLTRYIARKGSVCVDGVSLTVNAVEGPLFSVNIIPHTAAETIIGDYAVGDIVNIEVDMLARYLERLVAVTGDGISKEFLREHGYV